MSSDIAIRVKNICKHYQIYDKPQDRLKQSLWRGRKQFYREFKALDDVSFEIKKGETVGIIGRNGSGKSTLLQIICGTLAPTSGTVEVNGRVAALLELGAGFNPEFTGKENVYMNATILGLSKKEIDAKFEEIVSFADIGDFVFQPVKTYSSGMLVRLAFAVAINVDPEILIIDEALSVGDELFQRKCFSRIEAIKANGATILFVSHSGGQIVELCDRAVLMDSGEKLAVGLPKQIVGRYQKLIYAPADKQRIIREQIRQADEKFIISIKNISSESQEQRESIVHTQEPQESFDPNLKPNDTIAYESRGANIDFLQIQTLSGTKVNSLISGRKYQYFFKVKFNKAATKVRFGMLIKSTSGVALGGAYGLTSTYEAISLVESGQVVSVEFLFNCYLNPGVYFLNAGVLGFCGQEEIFLDRKVDALAFRVLPNNSNNSTEFINFSVESVLSIEKT